MGMNFEHVFAALASSPSYCTIHFSWTSFNPSIPFPEDVEKMKTSFLQYCIVYGLCISIHSIPRTSNTSNGWTWTDKIQSPKMSVRWNLTQPEILTPIFFHLLYSQRFITACIAQLPRVEFPDRNGIPKILGIHGTGDIGAPHYILIPTRFPYLGQETKNQANSIRRVNTWNTMKNESGSSSRLGVPGGGEFGGSGGRGFGGGGFGRSKGVGSGGSEGSGTEGSGGIRGDDIVGGPARPSNNVKNEKESSVDHINLPPILPSIILLLDEKNPLSLRMACFTCAGVPKNRFNSVYHQDFIPIPVTLVELNKLILLSHTKRTESVIAGIIYTWRKLHSNHHFYDRPNMQVSKSRLCKFLLLKAKDKAIASSGYLDLNMLGCMWKIILTFYNASLYSNIFTNRLKTFEIPFETVTSDEFDTFEKQKQEYGPERGHSTKVGTLQPLVHQLNTQFSHFRYILFIAEKQSHSVKDLESLLRPLEWKVWTWVLASVLSLQLTLFLTGVKNSFFWVVEIILGNGDSRRGRSRRSYSTRFELVPIMIWLFATVLLQNLYTFSLYSLIAVEPLPQVPSSMNELITPESGYPLISTSGYGTRTKSHVSVIIDANTVIQHIRTQLESPHHLLPGIPQRFQNSMACQLATDDDISGLQEQVGNFMVREFGRQLVKDFLRNLSEFQPIHCNFKKNSKYANKNQKGTAEGVLMQDLKVTFTKFAFIATPTELDYYQWLTLLIGRVGKMKVIEKSAMEERAQNEKSLARVEFSLTRNYFIEFYETTKARLMQAGIPNRFTFLLNAMRAGEKIKNLYWRPQEGPHTWNHFATLFAQKSTGIVRGFVEESEEGFKAADMTDMRVVWDLYILMMVTSGLVGGVELLGNLMKKICLIEWTKVRAW